MSIIIQTILMLTQYQYWPHISIKIFVHSNSNNIDAHTISISRQINLLNFQKLISAVFKRCVSIWNSLNLFMNFKKMYCYRFEKTQKNIQKSLNSVNRKFAFTYVYQCLMNTNAHTYFPIIRAFRCRKQLVKSLLKQ